MAPHEYGERRFGLRFQKIAQQLPIGPVLAIAKKNLHGRQDGLRSPARHQRSASVNAAPNRINAS
jgi:hypothetical protein